MISWLGILKAILSLANYFASYLHDRQLLEAGEYKAIARNNEEALLAIKAAQDARNALKSDPDSVRNDPGNRDR